MFKRIMQIFQKKFPYQDKVEVVVLGHQKTGTTVIASLLAKISKFSMSSDPLYVLDQGSGNTAELLIEKPDLISKYTEKHPKLFAKQIIKDPDFIFLYPSIKSYYLNAKFIYVLRDPRDTIRSICNRLGMSGTDRIINPVISDMERGNHHWELLLSGSLPKQNEAISETLSFVKKLAYRWCLSNDIYNQYQDDMLLVKYEDFLKDKEKSIADVANELGVNCKQSISQFVDIQYQPKGNSKVDWLEFFGDEHLHAIEDICSNQMKMYGYKPYF